MGVLEEHLVEVAHAEEEDRILVARLDLPILLDQWRARRRGTVLGHPCGHGTLTRKGLPPSLALMRLAVSWASARSRKGPTRTLW